MVRPSFIRIPLAAAIALAACSSAKTPVPSPPVSIAASPTLAVTNGVHVLASLPMPPGFGPIDGRPPQWLQNGTEIAVTGTVGGHVTVIGLSGQGWRSQRILAAEIGPDAAEEGSIVDAAASPDGMTFATAVALPAERRLDIVLRDLIAAGPGHPITYFDGVYDLVSMHWLSNSTLAIALRPRPESSATPFTAAPEADEPAAPRPKPS